MFPAFTDNAEESDNGNQCQTRSRITATSVMPSATKLGTSTAAPEAMASIATQSNGLSTKRGTIRSSFPDHTRTAFKPLPSRSDLKPSRSSGPSPQKPDLKEVHEILKRHRRRT